MRNNYKDNKWINSKFGHLTILGIGPNGERGTTWVCKCDCGNTILAVAARVYSKHVTSCGCAFEHRRHNLTFDETGKKNRLYSVWTTMRSRCNNKNDSSYQDYGGRGIKICDEWNYYPNFYEWAMTNGYDPLAPHGKCTLDRINNNGNYSPENCRWVDSMVQARNKRPPKHVEKVYHYVSDDGLRVLIDMAQMKLDGKSYKEIGEKYNISRQRVHQILARSTSRITHNI